jgi:2,4-dienoyl-CoA reductase-like NADH-dependent reductase (Old Yellow Enzyme family)
MDALAGLWQPFSCKSLKVKNRFAMSAMTRHFSPGGIPGDGVSAYYRRRAQGDVGLIITEGVGIDRPNSRNVTVVPEFCGAVPLAAWQKIVDGVHADGAAMAPQFWHVGGIPDHYYPNTEPAPLESASGLIGPAAKGGREMSEEDIADTIESFARAAADAQRLGFDAVELHAAHGYIFDQFFWSVTNLRADRYGGADIVARSRFAVEVCKAVRRMVGNDFALMMRVSQWKTNYYDVKLASTPDELEQWLRPLADAGVDIFDCSQRRFWEPEFAGSDLNFAGWVKKLIGRPTMTVGSLGLDRDLFADWTDAGESRPHAASLLELGRRFDRGDFDLVASGRALMADHAWLQKVRDGRIDELRPYSAEAMKTLY